VTLQLPNRQGWPPELRVLLEKYPREVWPTHANLGQTAQFWLGRHNMFRELGAMLGKATADFREGTLPADAFRPFFAPRLRFFLQELEGHHHIEDAHYFPVFRAAEPRLIRGFDVLEGDHDEIHREIGAVVDSANALLQRMASGPDDRRTATDQYAATSDRLLKSLLRHLVDEEDLIIPVILDRSEAALF
jgi:iron-sulfur cluster repair protein YtfE (RIC family)